MIRITDIHKSYSTHEVLRGVSLDIPTGTLQVLLGANGAGKSTLIHIVSGLMRSNAGGFFIDGEPITFRSYRYRAKVGYVFEAPMYVEKFTAREQLMFTGRMYGIKKDPLKTRVAGLLDFFELPDDGRYIESYSKGMRSKVSLAMALIHSPKYLILDEPFDGVDFVSVQQIGKLLKRMASDGVTIFITSHQYDVIAELGDRFALMQDGVIRFNRTMEELREMAAGFSHAPNPVKPYLESLMSHGEKKDLQWV